MCEYSTIYIMKEYITDAIMSKVVQLDSIGVISLHEKLDDKDPNKTWFQHFEDKDWLTKYRYSDFAKDFFKGIAEGVNEEEIFIALSLDCSDDGETILEHFKGLGAELRMWSEDCDGSSPNETTLLKNGKMVSYPVDYHTGESFIPAAIVHMISEYPSTAFKTVVLDYLQGTRFNPSAEIPKPYENVLPMHKNAEILGRLDDGEIEIGEALALIKESETPTLDEYMVFIESDYCDGQAYINCPSGEFGGDGYVELSSTYPICIGNYRGESPEQAIEQAASNMEASKEIFFAVKVAK